MNTLAPTDPRSSFATAVATARPVIDAVRPDQMTLPTVCSEFDVRGLLGHMLVVFDRITALGNGDDPMAINEAVVVTDDAWSAEFEAAAHRVQAAWADDAKLGQLMVLPWATAPGAAMVCMYTSELTVHTWDLAKATDQAAQWDEPTLQVALQTALQALPPGDREARFAEMAKDMPQIAGRPPFRSAVEVAEQASTLDRLIAWYGRRP